MLYVQNQGLTCLGKNLWYLGGVLILITGVDDEKILLIKII